MTSSEAPRRRPSLDEYLYDLDKPTAQAASLSSRSTTVTNLKIMREVPSPGPSHRDRDCQWHAPNRVRRSEPDSDSEVPPYRDNSGWRPEWRRVAGRLCQCMCHSGWQCQYYLPVSPLAAAFQRAKMAAFAGSGELAYVAITAERPENRLVGVDS